MLADIFLEFWITIVSVEGGLAIMISGSVLNTVLTVVVTKLIMDRKCRRRGTLGGNS